MAAEDCQDTNAEEAFVQLLTEAQTSLLNYISMLLGDAHAARNVLQETNLVLWRKARDFELGTNFLAWAHKIAYWQVQAYARDRKRDRHVFDVQLIEQLADIPVSEAVNLEMRVALRHCLDGISTSNRELLRMKYDGGLTTKRLAEHVGKSQGAVKVALMRIRKALLACIERKLAVE